MQAKLLPSKIWLDINVVQHRVSLKVCLAYVTVQDSSVEKHQRNKLLKG